MNYESTSNWLTLPLNTSRDNQQLLAKYVISNGGYTIYATDLCHIWSQYVTKQQLLSRAEEEQTSIDPSEDDTQLDIFLKKIDLALNGGEKTELSIVDEHPDHLTIAAKIALPRPLQALQWSFHLTLMPENGVRSEFILPLLKMTYEKCQQTEELVRVVIEKDNVISKILDKVESLGMELASIFPNTGGSKASRRGSRREMIAKYVRGLASFDREKWQEEFQSSIHSETTLNNLIRDVFARDKHQDMQRVVSSNNDGEPSDMKQSISQELESQSQRQNTPPISDQNQQSNKCTSSTVNELDQPGFLPTRTHERDHEDSDTTTDDEFEEATAPRTPRANARHIAANTNSLGTASPSPLRMQETSASSSKKKLGKLGGNVNPQQKSENLLRSQIESHGGTSSFTEHDHTSRDGSPTPKSSIKRVKGRQPIKLGKLGGSRPLNTIKPLLESHLAASSSSSSDEGHTKSPTASASNAPKPVPPTRKTKPSKLGKIGGAGGVSREDNLEVTPNISPKLSIQSKEQKEASRTAMPKPSPRKLGRIGGRSDGSSQSHRDAITSVEPASNTSRAGTGMETQSKEDAVDHSNTKLEEPPATAETTEQKADRKREELKRALESSNAVIGKKKRRF